MKVTKKHFPKVQVNAYGCVKWDTNKSLTFGHTYVTNVKLLMILGFTVADSGGISVHTLAIDRKLKTYRVGEVNWMTLQDHTPTILRDLPQDVRDELKPKLDVTTPSYTFNCRRTSSREALKKSYFTLSHDRRHWLIPPKCRDRLRCHFHRIHHQYLAPVRRQKGCRKFH